MPKKLLSIIAGLVLLTPVFLQVSSVSVRANHDEAMTSPVTFFNIVGRITYRQLGGFFSAAQRTVGADDIVVTATNFFNRNQKFTTTTDPNGVYSFNIPEGLYQIRVDDPSDKANFFVPPLDVERVGTHRADKANFQGLIFP